MKKKDTNEQSGMEIGIYTLADLCPNPDTGKTLSTKQRLKEIIEAAKLADEAGLDVFGVGEHHRKDYAVSAPNIVLAAASRVTDKINLTSATTVLNTIDPVRLFEDFATLDLISDGRAEIIAGRGAYFESFALFGYDVEKYDELFEENLGLLLRLNSQEKVSWRGNYRPELKEAVISPRPVQNKIPISVGVGGSMESAARAGRLGIGLTLVILDGDPSYYKSLIDEYRKAGEEAGHDPNELKVAVTGHAYISKTTKQAKEEYYPYHSNYWANINRQHGLSGETIRSHFERMAGPDTALLVGSPQQVIEKILKQYELFGHQRFIAQVDIGGMPFKKVAQNIEMLATEVAPVIRKATKNGAE